MRSAWIEKRRGDANVSQMHYARQGLITEEMAYVAKRENLPESLVMEEVARGRMIIPANINHTNLEPMAIGIASRCKVNANIGASPNASDLDEEVAKLRLAVKYGADTVMDLSTGGVNLDEVRTAIINASTVPIGTVPVYQALESVHGSIEKLDADDFLHIIEKHCQQGVDYQTIHAGLLIEHLPLVKGRLTGIVSRGGGILAQWMLYHHKQNPLFTRFDDIIEIFKRYDCSFSLGDSLRPGCQHDASDAAQLAELKTLGQLTRRAWEHDIQVMVEGPGPCADGPDRVQRQEADGGVQRGALLRARSPGDGHRPRLRPHHQRHRRGPGGLARHGDALLRDPEGAPGPAQRRGCA